MLRVIAVALVAVSAFAPAAHADPGYCIANGHDQGGANGECSNVDPMHGEENRLPNDEGIYLAVDASENGAGASFAVGDEENSGVGRVSVYVSPDGASFYIEDHTEGDMVADAIEGADEATGGFLLGGDTSTDSDSDTLTVHT